MVEQYTTACPLDCPDVCSLIVHKEGNRIVGIKGNPNHPITQGFICEKGRKLTERVYHYDRLTTPLKKTEIGWQRISWKEAYDLIAEKLNKIKAEYGTKAIYHHYESGSEGVLNGLDRRFFNAYGGVSQPRGSLCWGAGYAAQEYDFGGVYSHDWSDLENSKTVLLWGRDPVTTNIHLVPFIKRAKEKGAKVVVINPIKTRTADLSHLHLAPRPGTDGALALGIAFLLLENRWIDINFIKEHVHGFEEYVNMAKNYYPARVAKITGLSVTEIEELAKLYAHKPSAIVLGYGLQRYSNSGKTVRAINALAALTGNIGVAGGGVSYAHQYWMGMFADLKGADLAREVREFKRPLLADELLKASNPPIKAIFVTRSNPVNQLANSAKVLEAFGKVEFKVVVDFFLNDTALLADLVLPCTTIFEEENIIFNNWNNYIHYTPKIIDPIGQAKSDFEIFSDLARLMGLEGFPGLSQEQWLEKFLAPANNVGINLDLLKERGFLRNPKAKPIAWTDKKFSTETGKIELLSQRALKEGLEPLPVYEEPQESIIRNPELAKQYPLHLISSHPKGFMHSQFYNSLKNDEGSNFPVVEINPLVARKLGVRNSDKVFLETPRGGLKGITKLNDGLREDVVQVFEGMWIKDGGGINFLTPELESDLGVNASYYDCLCKVSRLED